MYITFLVAPLAIAQCVVFIAILRMIPPSRLARNSFATSADTLLGVALGSTWTTKKMAKLEAAMILLYHLYGLYLMILHVGLVICI